MKPTGTTVAAPAPASVQLTLDPPQPPAADGWSPARIRPVTSHNPRGFVGSAVQFARGVVNERPGQRLSVSMVDELAQYFGQQFGVDPQQVTRELSQVYVYVGGPAAGGSQAVTVGHHIFVPDEQALQTILSPQGKRWLTHELAHTMQFAAYGNRSIYRTMSQYLKALVVGVDPERPGSGTGSHVWGAAFTALGSRAEPEGEIGLARRGALAIAPAAAVGIPLGLAAGGALAGASAATSRRVQRLAPHVPSALESLRLGAGVIAVPAILGGVAGGFSDALGYDAGLLGALAGAGAAATTSATSASVRGLLRRSPRLGAAALATSAVGGALTGFASATLGANTVDGWSRNAQALSRVRERAGLDHRESSSYSQAVHDAHWQEIEAELLAHQLVSGDDTSVSGETQPRSDFQQPGHLRDRLDWALYNPLIVGVPLAVAAGGSVTAARVARGALVSTLRGGGLSQTLRTVWSQLSSTRRGALNSLGVGAAATVLPLIAGGSSAGVLDELRAPTTVSKAAGAAAGAAATGAALTMLLRGSRTSRAVLRPAVLGGTLLGGGFSYMSASAAVNAAHPRERTYVR